MRILIETASLGVIRLAFEFLQHVYIAKSVWATVW